MPDHGDGKKEYETPKIVHTEKMTARAVTCGKVTGLPECAPFAPVNS